MSSSERFRSKKKARTNFAQVAAKQSGQAIQLPEVGQKVQVVRVVRESKDPLPGFTNTSEPVGGIVIIPFERYMDKNMTDHPLNDILLQ